MNWLLITLLLLICSYVYLKLAEKFNIVDNPNFRSSHTIPTIRGGGILFYIAIFLFFILSGYQYLFFFIGISIIAFISFLDDIYTLSSRIRLPFQFLSVALVIYQLHLFDFNIIIPLTICVIGVGFINVYNFMDGINGITGLYSITVLASFLGINYIEPTVVPNLILYVLFSLIIFGFYNFRNKARMFAGDIGSISLAMIILFLTIMFAKELQSPLILLIPIVYCIDGVLTIFYRMYLKEKIMEPHRHHIYQKLVDVLHWGHIKVSICYAIIQLIINIIIIYFLNNSLQMQLFLMLFIISTLCLIYFIIFKKIDKVKTNST